MFLKGQFTPKWRNIYISLLPVVLLVHLNCFCVSCALYLEYNWMAPGFCCSKGQKNIPEKFVPVWCRVYFFLLNHIINVLMDKRLMLMREWASSSTMILLALIVYRKNTVSTWHCSSQGLRIVLRHQVMISVERLFCSVEFFKYICCRFGQDKHSAI